MQLSAVTETGILNFMLLLSKMCSMVVREIGYLAVNEIVT